MDKVASESDRVSSEKVAARDNSLLTSPDQVLAEVARTLDRARELMSSLQQGLDQNERAVSGALAAIPGVSPARLDELERELADVDRDREDLTTRLVEAENQLNRLMGLYVATFQLHATLDPTEVQATIAEIAVDLLGAERFILLLRDKETGDCEVSLERGLEEDSSSLYANKRYVGGDPLVDAALEDGILRMGPDQVSNVIAAVPLRVQDAIVGALVITKLFDHKAILRSEDRDLLDLLAAHAASALFAARVYSKTDRKLRTLESLVQLVRGA